MERIKGYLASVGLIGISAIGWTDLIPALQVVSLLIGIGVGITTLILHRQKYLINKNNEKINK